MEPRRHVAFPTADDYEDAAADPRIDRRERGAGAGDRVGVALRNYPEWIAAFMGVTSLGAVAVALNAWWSGEELLYGIDDSGLQLLFADVERTERLAGQLVEAVLYEYPKVLEAAVFGVPDERLGETLAAVVVARRDETLTAGDVRAFAAEHVAKFKVPDHVWVRAERLPRIASEKIFKRGLREEALRRLVGEGE